MTDDGFEEIPPLNPAQCEAWIRRVSERIARGVRIVTDAEKAMLATKRDFDYAFANAFKNAQGSDNLRRQTAVVDAMPWREKADNAVIAFKYAQRTAEGLERELFAAMSINKSVISMYAAAGWGKREPLPAHPHPRLRQAVRNRAGRPLLQARPDARRDHRGVLGSRVRGMARPQREGGVLPASASARHRAH